MTEIRYVITDEEGIHARPAGNLVKFVKGLGCAATITKGEKTADLTKLMAVMSLGVKKGIKLPYPVITKIISGKLKDF